MNSSDYYTIKVLRNPTKPDIEELRALLTLRTGESLTMVETLKYAVKQALQVEREKARDVFLEREFVSED